MADLTAKQEEFARVYVLTSNASEAYRTAYDVEETTKPETIWSNASRILADSKVKTRVLELQEEAKRLCLVSIGSLTQELEEARSHAMKDEKGASAAVSAIMGKAKLHKLLDEEKATGGVNVTIAINGQDAAIL